MTEAVCFNTVCCYREFTFILSHSFYFCAQQNSRSHCQRKTNHSTTSLDESLNATESYNCREKKATAFHGKDPWVYTSDSKALQIQIDKNLLYLGKTFCLQQYVLWAVSPLVFFQPSETSFLFTLWKHSDAENLGDWIYQVLTYDLRCSEVWLLIYISVSVLNMPIRK